MLNVEFEWFDPQPAYDYHGIKTLLQQLFDVDAHLFNLSAVTDLILAQPLLGSTVKVDGNETDPYAFLSVLNLQGHMKESSISKIVEYIQQKAKTTPSLGSLSDLLSSTEIPSLGLILTERLINVPAEVTGPMYSMLLEEIQWALEEKEPYNFSHYLILSKVYTELASELDPKETRPKKKSKGSQDNPILYFHPEDEVLERHSICYGHFDYTTKQDAGYSDSKRAFQEMGIRPRGQMMLIEASKFKSAVKDVAQFLQVSG